MAISLTETGRKLDGGFRPWPWTVNMEGKGHWFGSHDEALHYVRESRDAGARSFDVGCFQINYRWHAQHFASLDAMFDPLTNARYAARFLSELHGETGDWSAAAGAFHSRTEVYASRYRKIFDRHRQRLGGSPEVREERYAVSANDNQPVEPATPAAPRANAYPLLRGGTTGALGSLVPVDARAGRPLFVATTGTEG
ncbi:MAG: transglycosylase SLT domain-containing protein [Paracoccaceae bacterium]